MVLADFCCATSSHPILLFTELATHAMLTCAKIVLGWNRNAGQLFALLHGDGGAHSRDSLCALSAVIAIYASTARQSNALSKNTQNLPMRWLLPTKAFDCAALSKPTISTSGLSAHCDMVTHIASSAALRFRYWPSQNICGRRRLSPLDRVLRPLSRGRVRVGLKQLYMRKIRKWHDRITITLMICARSL